MGACISDESNEEKKRRKQEQEHSRRLDQEIVRQNQKELAVNKLLLLGAGESGKSTLVKQMVMIYGEGFSEQERKNHCELIWNNCFQSIKTLIIQSKVLDQIESPEAKKAEQFLAGMRTDAKLTAEVAENISWVWADKGIQKTYNQRAKFQLVDSTQYFLDKVEQIGEQKYIPTPQDVLRVRIRTTGIVENEFTMEGNKFKVFDVGGQRNERKKWIHCFEDVTGVIFVAAASVYDQVLYEDDTTNRMVEALNLFEEIANCQWFQDTAMILFLNKRDLFAEKIEKVSLRYCFPDYDGQDNYADGIEFLQKQFESRSDEDREIYTHITNATDTTNVHRVFDAVKDIIIKRSLNEAGLV